jgi:hypothetical protein
MFTFVVLYLIYMDSIIFHLFQLNVSSFVFYFKIKIILEFFIILNIYQYRKFKVDLKDLASFKCDSKTVGKSVFCYIIVGMTF